MDIESTELFEAFDKEETPVRNKHIRFPSSSESERPNAHTDILIGDSTNAEENDTEESTQPSKSSKRKKRRRPVKVVRNIRPKGPLSASKALQIASLIDEFCPDSRQIQSFPEKLDRFLIEFANLKSSVTNGSQTESIQDYSVFGSVTGASGQIYCTFKAPLAPNKMRLAQELIDRLEVKLYGGEWVPKSPLKLDESFVIDAEGHGGKLIAESISDTPDSNTLPNYEKNGWAAPLSSQSQLIESEEESVGPKRVPNLCFNCSGDHSVRDCPVEKNQDEINKNRLEYMKRVGDQFNQPRASRYCGDNPKFANLKAGVIGEELRNALGLRDDEVPPWIYHMRNLGVPPGYMKEAVVDDLHMYDIHGNKPETDMSEEDGVIEDEDGLNYGSLELSLVPEWPGYNVPLPEGVRDDYRRLGFPPMYPENSKTELERLVREAKSLKRKPSQTGSSRSSPPATKRLKHDQSNKKDPSVLMTSPPVIELSSDSEVDLATKTELAVSVQYVIETDIVTESVCGDETPKEKSHISRSVSIDFGTPARLKQSGSTPSLDKFAAGIQPFEPREERPPMEGKGFKHLRRILNEVKAKLKGDSN